MKADSRSLEARIFEAKYFLNSQMTALKTQQEPSFVELDAIGHQINTLHELERIGVRKLTDLDFIRAQRILSSIESQMVSKN
jgi:hypothetical protein